MRQSFQATQRRAMLRIGSLVIVVITVAALAAPVALADKWGTATRSSSGATLRPDDRSGVRGPTLPVVATAASRPDDRSGHRGGGPTLVAASVAPVVAVQTGDASFQWGDAGIGAGFAFVAMMLVVGGIVLVARQRTARPSTS